MEIQILQRNEKYDLYAYENDTLLFYSTIEFNYVKSNVIKIFDGYKSQILELKTRTPFFNTRYKIVSQNESVTKNICEIQDGKISFENGKIIQRKRKHFFALNNDVTYLFEGVEIAQIKQKMWNLPQKIRLIVKEEKFLKIIILHILATRTEQRSD